MSHSITITRCAVLAAVCCWGGGCAMFGAGQQARSSITLRAQPASNVVADKPPEMNLPEPLRSSDKPAAHAAVADDNLFREQPATDVPPVETEGGPEPGPPAENPAPETPAPREATPAGAAAARRTPGELLDDLVRVLERRVQANPTQEDARRLVPLLMEQGRPKAALDQLESEVLRPLRRGSWHDALLYRVLRVLGDEKAAEAVADRMLRDVRANVPLGLENLTIIQPGSYKGMGRYVPKDPAVYRTGETVELYFELFHLTQSFRGDTADTSVDLEVDLIVMDDRGKKASWAGATRRYTYAPDTVYDMPAKFRFINAPRHFALPFGLDLPSSAPPGEYTLLLTVRDLNRETLNVTTQDTRFTLR